MLYLDSGVFVYATLSREALGDRARLLLKKVRDRLEEAATCALTFDELVWVVRKHRSREDAIAAGESFLALRNLTILEVDQDVLLSAVSLMRRYPLDPRDAIHASSAIIGGCAVIVSSDIHFDQIRELKRRAV